MSSHSHYEVEVLLEQSSPVFTKALNNTRSISHSRPPKDYPAPAPFVGAWSQSQSPRATTRHHIISLISAIILALTVAAAAEPNYLYCSNRTLQTSICDGVRLLRFLLHISHQAVGPVRFLITVRAQKGKRYRQLLRISHAVSKPLSRLCKRRSRGAAGIGWTRFVAISMCVGGGNCFQATKVRISGWWWGLGRRCKAYNLLSTNRDGIRITGIEFGERCKPASTPHVTTA